MKTLVLIVSFFVFCLPSFAQCNLTLKDSPVIRGLKLGITKTEVEKVIPLSSGVKLSSFLNYLTTTQLSKIKGFESLDSLDITFMRENFESKIYRVSTLSFRYKNSLVEWDSVIEFADNISTNLTLPFDAWSFADNQAVMKCKDFKITIVENYINLQSTTLENDSKKLKEQKKKDFKP